MFNSDTIRKDQLWFVEAVALAAQAKQFSRNMQGDAFNVFVLDRTKLRRKINVRCRGERRESRGLIFYRNR